MLYSCIDTGLHNLVELQTLVRHFKPKSGGSSTFYSFLFPSSWMSSLNPYFRHSGWYVLCAAHHFEVLWLQFMIRVSPQFHSYSAGGRILLTDPLSQLASLCTECNEVLTAKLQLSADRCSHSARRDEEPQTPVSST